MIRTRWTNGWILRLSLAAALGVRVSSGFASVDYERSIRPLLAERCGSCHSDEERSSEFSVADLGAVLAGGEKFGAAVVPGLPEESPLVQVLRGSKTPRMPLRGRLTEEEIGRIEEWIRGLSAGESERATPSVEKRWAFEKPSRPVPPTVERSDWVRNPIDAFVLGKLEGVGLSPAPEADRRVLARRVHLDLLGVVPSPEEMNAFINDTSSSAYEALIDRLLDDPRYGERWGRHWLDLVRYGETSGLEGDGPIGNAWRYRDWVIDAFNRDMPYDEFAIQQIAGADEHSKTRLNYQPDVQGHIPAGFLRLAPWDRSNLVADLVRQNYLNEITATTSSVFLGLTVGCAQCHDHKYDPIPTRDFYRLQAFFSAVQVVSDVEVPYKDKTLASQARAKVAEYEELLKDGPDKRALDAHLARLREKLIASRKSQARGRPLSTADLRLEIRRDASTVFTPTERERHAELLEDAFRTGDVEEQEALKSYESDLLDKLRRAHAEPGADPLARFEALTAEDVRQELEAPYSSGSFFDEADQSKYQELSSRLEVFRRRLGRWRPVVLTVRNVPGPPNGPGVAPTHVLFRGDYQQPREEVAPGFPSALTGHSKPAVIETDRYRQFPTRGWRMTLAKWIASADNPLTARVMVNRIWQHHFGRGIVGTPSDFGKNGEPPTHPGLLDWLAHTFVERGWSIKAMHRLILESNTYRQASENSTAAGDSVDPENRLLWRFNRRRMDAESLRDSVLHVSGRLNPERGGPSVFPPLPADLADFARYGRTGGLMWEPNESEADRHRRSVYVFQRRSLPLPMMASFDAPVFSESCPSRSVTTTPFQALTLLNGSLVRDAARDLARSIKAEAGEDRQARITLAYERVLNRAPDAAELTAFLAFPGDLEGVCRVLLNSNEFLYVD
ncbi:MAG: PSD1 and planctomycete cytochrome C domain-containing protein [Isosphaeraceae bacterium]